MGKTRVHIQSEKRPLACSNVSQEGRREESRQVWESRFSEGVGGALWGIAFMRLGCTLSYSGKCDAQASRFMRPDCKSLPRPWWGSLELEYMPEWEHLHPCTINCCCRRSYGAANIQREEGAEEPGHRPCEGSAQETWVKTKIPLEDASYDSFCCGAWLCRLGQALDYRAGRASQQRYS